MTYTTTFRATARTALLAFLDAWKTADATIQQTYRARPRTLHAPCAFIGDWRESVNFDAQLGTRTPTVDIHLISGQYDNAESMDRQDVLVDGFLSYVGNHSRVSIGVIIVVSIADAEVTLPGRDGASTATYLDSIVSLTLDAAEGGL